MTVPSGWCAIRIATSPMPASGPRRKSCTRHAGSSHRSVTQGSVKARESRDSCRGSAGLRDQSPGCGVERFGMGPTIVLGQDLTEVAGPVRDGAVTDLAAGDRKLGNGHREAAGR
jgi:hypothetical protein